MRSTQQTVHNHLSSNFCSHHGMQKGYGSKPLSGLEASSIPLTQSLPGLPPPQFAEVTDHTYDTQVTTLENGMKVATENRFGQFCTVGGKQDIISRKKIIL